MKVTYTGVHRQLPEKLQAKANAKFAKLAKLLDGRGEREAHVILKQERHLQCAEITVQFHDHKLVGEGSDSDLFTAISTALVKIEKQAVKLRAKWRTVNRHKELPKPKAEAKVESKPPAAKRAKPNGDSPKKRVFRVDRSSKAKPMTVDEAILEMDGSRDYMAYRDAEHGGLAVLVRRADGHYDLIES